MTTDPSSNVVERLSLRDAFDMGFAWRGDLIGQTLEDSRAVGRTLTSDLFHERLELDLSEFDSFTTADNGIVASKAIIHAALDKMEAATIERLSAELERVKRDLEPFIPQREEWMDEWPDDASLSLYRANRTYGDLRRAWAALSNTADTRA